jgi:hypothetical protein
MKLYKTSWNNFWRYIKDATRDKRKHLLQLLINKITSKKPKERSRTINKVDLDFDFTEVNISKIFTLIHMLYRETDTEVENSLPQPVSENKILPYLQLFCFYLWFTTINPKLFYLLKKRFFVSGYKAPDLLKGTPISQLSYGSLPELQIKQFPEELSQLIIITEKDREETLYLSFNLNYFFLLFLLLNNLLISLFIL